MNATWPPDGETIAPGYTGPEETALFFMDNASPRPDGPDAGTFYNKAPRFTVFSNTSFANASYRCEPGGEAD